MALAPLSAGFQSLPLLPTIKLGVSGAASWVGGCVYILGPCGSLQLTLLWGWEFLPLPPQPPQEFSISGEAFFPQAGTLGCAVCLPVHQLLPRRPAAAWPAPLYNLPPCWSTSHCLAARPLCPGCLSPPLLLVWVSVSSLSPWLSDFYTVRFFCKFRLFIVFKLLLSFFWLCEEAQCVHLHLHLGRKWLLKF